LWQIKAFFTRKKEDLPRTIPPMTNVARHPASFKDPAGFIFEANGKITGR
jgi:hypothetical protein